MQEKVHMTPGITALQATLSFTLPKIQEKRRARKHKHDSEKRPKPYVLFLSGPQGSGKSTLLKELRSEYKERKLRVAVLSLDDLYWTYEEQLALRERTHNPLHWSRGLPGTHDVALGTSILHGLIRGESVWLPRFDKAAHGGEGDRSEKRVLVSGCGGEEGGGIDVVVFEGWCLGYDPMTEEELREAWEAHRGEIPEGLRESLRFEDVAEVNEAIRVGTTGWLALADAVVELRSEGIAPIYRWREQAEECLRRISGSGLTPEAIRSMVDRFSVMYRLWWPWMRARDASRAVVHDRLIIRIDDQRNVVGIE